MGTPSYMAPEQVRGENDRVGPLADVYALGAILYECLTGRPPFLAATPLETMRQVADLDPVPPTRLLPQVPRDLEVVCLKCLEKEPAKRYAGAGELAADLRRFLDGEPIRARRVHMLERAWRWARRRPAVAGLLLALAVALLAGTGLSSYFAVEAGRRAGQAQTKEHEATAARDAARAAREKADQQSAELLLERGLKLAREGQVAEGLAWMLAALRASPEPDFRRLVRTHLASWGSRAPTLVHWLDTPHRRAAFSPDGRLFVTAGKPGPEAGDEPVSLQFWDLPTDRPLGEPVPTGDLDMRSLAFSPDGHTLLAANGSIQQYQGRPGWATRWDVAGRQSLGRLTGHRQCVLCAAWAPGGRRVLTGSLDQTVRVWDAATGQPVGRPWAHPSEVRSLAVSPDGRWALTGAVDSAHLWEVATGEPVGPPLRPGVGVVLSVAFGADGQTLLVAGRDRGAKDCRWFAQHFDPAARRLVGPLREAPHPTGEITILPDGRAVPWSGVSPDGRWLQRGADGIQLWRLARDRTRPAEAREPPDGEPRNSSPTPLPARLTAAGSLAWVTLAGSDRALAWDLSTGQPTGVAVPHAPRWESRPRLAASADGRLVAAVLPRTGPGLSESVQVWEAGTGRPAGPALTEPNAVMALAFSPDGRVLATGGDFHVVHLWDVAAGKPLGPPLPQGDIVLDLAFSPDGQTLAVGTWGREVRLWDVARQQPLLPPLPHEEQVGRVCFSPDGTRLATLCPGVGYLWDARTGEKIATLKPYRPLSAGRPWTDLQLLYSPDGGTLLTSTGHGSFRLWNASTGQPLGPPTPLGEAQLSCFAFSPDGRLVVAGHEDGTAQLWEAATSRPLGAPAVQPLAVTGVAFAPDGRGFLTVAADGTVRSWPVPAPLEGDDERVALSVQLSTGLRLDDGRAVVPLTRVEWEELRRRWREREGEADWAVGPPAPDEDWHDARARDAEQAGRAFTARWHLDRLIAARPDDGRLYLRRARTHTEEGRWDEAGADYRRALERTSPEGVLAWQRQRAWVCQARGQWLAARWYLDRLLAAQPDDPELRRRRTDVSAKLVPN
jgi:WD40 repeat protein